VIATAPIGLAIRSFFDSPTAKRTTPVSKSANDAVRSVNWAEIGR